MFGILLPLMADAAFPAAAPPPYPAKEVIAEFGKVCARLEKADQTRIDLTENGWISYEPVTASPLAELIAFGREAGARMLKDSSGSMTPTAVYHKRVADEELDIVLSGVVTEGVIVNGCRLYDIGETRQITSAEASSWMAREPDRKVEQPQVSVLTWKPGKLVSHNSFEVYFVPQGSPLIAMLKFSGLALKADYVGASK